MRLVACVLIGLSLCASALAQTPPADLKPELYDASEAGGRVSNANGKYAGEAAKMASDHCRRFGKDMMVTGITAERMSLIFSCMKIEPPPAAN